jgi:hypothetical protein
MKNKSHRPIGQWLILLFRSYTNLYAEARFFYFASERIIWPNLSRFVLR